MEDLIRKIAVVLCLTGLSLSAQAKEYIGTAKTISGQVQLNDSNGVPSPLPIGGIKIEIENPSPITSPRRWFNGEKVLKLTASEQQSYSFRVPKVVRKTDNEFSVHKKTSEQLAHLTSTINRYNQRSEQLTTDISCSYMIMMPTTSTSVDANGNVSVNVSMTPQFFPGTERAHIQNDYWTEEMILQVYDEQENHVEIRSQPEAKSQMTVLQRLSSCG